MMYNMLIDYEIKGVKVSNEFVHVSVLTVVKSNEGKECKSVIR